MPSYILDNGRVTDGKIIPKLSTALDSVRTYQWEITFQNLPEGVETGDAKPLTIAAKQILNLDLLQKILKSVEVTISITSLGTLLWMS